MLVPVYDIRNCGPSHRFSANGKLVHNSLWNPQNLPRVCGKPSDAIRTSLRAPVGCKVLVADLSGIELRMNHFLWMVPSSMALFQDDPAKADLYKDFASKLYSKPVEDVTKAERQIGKLCIAEGSPVLTDKGLVPIEKVTTSMRVWDGVEWVEHDGAIYQGEKEVITYDSVTATPDHIVYLRDGSACRLDEAANKGVEIARTGGAVDGSDCGALEFTVVQTKRRVWDILNAGPRRRFTVSGRLVSNCHLGLGYGAGAKTFVRIAKLMGGVDLSEPDSLAIVNAWRAAHQQIAQGWKTCDRALYAMRDGEEYQIDPWGLCRTAHEAIITPRGILRYPKLRKEADGFVCGEGRNIMHLRGALIVENIVQHLSRHVMTDAMLKYAASPVGKRWPIVHTVHDELVVITLEEVAPMVLQYLQNLMRTPPEWFPQLVLWSEGDIADNYGAAK